MSTIFNLLNYITGFLFFVILFATIKSNAFIKKLLIVLSLSFLISLLFSLFQKYYSISLGNMPYWVEHNQINSTFKDPNAFGAYLSAFLPLLLGLTIYFRKYTRLYFASLIIFGLFILPSIASRSALLSLGISSFTFFLLFLLSHRGTHRKKFVFIISFLLIAIVISLSFVIFFKQSNLYKRMEWSLDLFATKDYLNPLFTGKINNWTVACIMIKEYPLTGVGLGAYIVELPNYLELIGLPFKHTDSAENYFLQIGAECGFIGFFIVLWLFLEIIRQIKRSWKEFPVNSKDKYILIGAISGLVSLFVNFLFHSYIGSYEVKYFFWLLIALVFVYPNIIKTSEFRFKLSQNFKIISIITVLVFGSIHLWNSTHSLSIKHKTRKFGWNQNFGLYRIEKDQTGFSFQWIKRSAGITVENMGPVLVIPMMASHPDIEKHPVKAKIFLADNNFKKKELIKEMIFNKKKWINFTYQIPDPAEKKICLIFETDREWQPLKYLGVPDSRSLAIGMGEIWFKYPSELSGLEIKDIQNIPSENWDNTLLASNGISHIKFQTSEKNIALRLNVKGQKAFNIGPYIIIRLDKQIIGKTQLTEESWTSLIFMPEISKGEHVLSVEFINDFYNPELGQDRNVFLGDLEIICLR